VPLLFVWGGGVERGRRGRCVCECGEGEEGEGVSKKRRWLASDEKTLLIETRKTK